MSKKETKDEKKVSEWRAGYEAGIRAMMNQNSRAIRIGEAIINVMSEIFAFKEEDY